MKNVKIKRRNKIMIKDYLVVYLKVMATLLVLTCVLGIMVWAMKGIGLLVFAILVWWMAQVMVGETFEHKVPLLNLEVSNMKVILSIYKWEFGFLTTFKNPFFQVAIYLGPVSFIWDDQEIYLKIFKWYIIYVKRHYESMCSAKKWLSFAFLGLGKKAEENAYPIIDKKNVLFYFQEKKEWKDYLLKVRRKLCI
jgi:hypothetical protein